MIEGQSIGSYRILQKIGTGGMGAVYLAEHPLIGKKVALKVIHRDLANNKEVVQRFFQEAKAVTRIGNEHIISIHDFGQTPEGDHFYIMEYLEGQTLAQVISRDRVLDIMRALHVGAQIASALAAAHAAGVIHRDLKPDNVMLTHRLGDPDFVVLLDFGLAKMFAGADGPSAVKTAAGVLLGTPQYMSPEACESRGTADHRTDIYALGILLFQMMTGVLPFDGETMGEVLVKQVTQLPPPPRGFNPSIPPAVEQIVLRCLAKNPDARFPTMHAMRDALLDPEAYLRNSPPIAPTRSMAPGEVKVDAKTVMAYAAQQQAEKLRTAGYPAAGTGPQQAIGGQARTMISDGSLVPPRPGAGQAPGMVGPAMPKMNTMRIATPVGYSSRPPRKMWPVVLVLALLLGLGGGAFAVAWFGRKDPNAVGASAPAATGESDATGNAAGSAGAAPQPNAAVPSASTKGSASGSAAAPTKGASAGSNAAATPSKADKPAGSGSVATPSTSDAPQDVRPVAPPDTKGSAVAPPDTKGSAVAPPDTKGSAASSAPMAIIVMDSTPAGAEVIGPDKKSHGKTPARLTLPISDMPIALELRLPGYRKKVKQLIVSGNAVIQVTLDRAPPQTGGGKAKSGFKVDSELMRPD